MCGIVGAISNQNVTKILIDGLKHLEYRGYDSAGIAIVDDNNNFFRIRCLGKVQELENKVFDNYSNLDAKIGIAHTRWATHGKPSENNAHPHISDNIVVVHNGIIENYEILRDFLVSKGFTFVSQTDTEVIAHLIKYFTTPNAELTNEVFGQKAHKKINTYLNSIKANTINTLDAVKLASCILEGAYGMVVFDKNNPNELIASRLGSPLVIGLTDRGNYLASDQLALIEITQKFIYLEEGDIAYITKDNYKIYDSEFNPVTRKIINSDIKKNSVDKGDFDHFMLKEIYEQPQAIIDTIEGRIAHDRILVESIGSEAREILNKVDNIQIIACGTSYHAALLAKYWIERYAHVSCEVDIASEYRYRSAVVRPNSLIVTISQSGETADTLAALRKAKNSKDFLASMTVCNVPTSSLVRESDLKFLTHCGVEIGVASTKAFTSQLAVLLMFACALAEVKHTISEQEIKDIAQSLVNLPKEMTKILTMSNQIKNLSLQLTHINNCLFLGRDTFYPIMKEADLKLKELSYVHSEAFPGGELKHGPLALIDENMTIFGLCVENNLVEKMCSNIEEVLARNGITYLFTDNAKLFSKKENLTILEFPKCSQITSPICYTIAYQLLAYYMAVSRGCDVDKPRNLAKSVTVE